MPIAHQYKSIFIHIPKTAGTSIEQALGIKKWDKKILRLKKEHKIDKVLYAPQHYTGRIVKGHPHALPYWEKYFKFSIVRHPYTRTLSEFWWVHRHKGPKFKFTSEIFSHHLSKYYHSLDKDHKLSQYDFLYDENDKLLVDYVGKFEKLDETFNFLKKKLNVSTSQLPQIHKSRNKKQLVNLLTKKQKKFIQDLYHKDFEKFRYQK